MPEPRFSALTWIDVAGMRAERLIRFTNLVGRENVVAGAYCGFSSQALYKTEVHPTVVWEKFKAMREGADLATERLWEKG